MVQEQLKKLASILRKVETQATSSREKQAEAIIRSAVSLTLLKDFIGTHHG